MSQENVEVVRSTFDALNEGGLDAGMAYITDDCDFAPVEAALSGPMRGKASMRAYLQEFFRTFDDFKLEPLEVLDAGGGRVVAVVSANGRAKLTGIQTDLTFAGVYTVRDGKIAGAHEFPTRAEALGAANAAPQGRTLQLGPDSSAG
jgi:ketosteroid isomerase-like protein